MVNRRQAPMGTPRYLPVNALLPLNAPIQPRRYLTPSTTACKGAFQSQQWPGGNEQDELTDESNVMPGADLKALQWKRRQNTLAVRKPAVASCSIN